MATKIQWTGETWNPLVGCSLASPGCTNCYAMRDAYRKGFNPKVPHYAGLTKIVNGNPVWTGKIVQSPGIALVKPMRRRKATTYFVNSMSDLFHEDVPDDWIDRIFAVMALCPQHTFQVLTKRAERMRNYLGVRTGDWMTVLPDANPPGTLPITKNDVERSLGRAPKFSYDPATPVWPLPNVWLGVSVEDQKRATERIPHLRATPAAVRFLSCEPLLGEIDLEWTMRPDGGDIHWTIIGGESGPKARGCWTPAVRSLMRQCQSLGIAVFNKQLGTNVRDRNDAGWYGDEPDSWPDGTELRDNPDGWMDGYQGAPVRVLLKHSKGGDPAEWPEDLRIRQFPATRAGGANG